jgi:hypothetical protein
MAKAYNRKEVSVLRSSRYAKELAPCKLDLRRIFHAWSSLGVNKPLLLGSGIEGEAWQIAPKIVLKIHRSRDKYLGLTNLSADPRRIEALRPKVFTVGSFNTKLFWVVMEKFDTFDEYDLDLDILIAEVSYYVERSIDDFREAASFNLKNTKETISLIDLLFPYVLSEFNIKSDYPPEQIISIKNRYSLGYYWFQHFIKHIIYLHITERADDLWLPNLGISRFGAKYGRLIFFDW